MDAPVGSKATRLRTVYRMFAVLCVTALAGPLLADEGSLIELYGGVENAPAEKLSGLNLHVNGIANANGKIVALVFDDARAYLAYDHTQAVGSATLDAKSGSLDTHFPELTAGPYAVFLFHDENGDFELNLKRGFPLEGYAYSGASDPTGVPSFEQAAIDSDEIAVELVYLGQRSAEHAQEPSRAAGGPWQQRRNFVPR